MKKIITVILVLLIFLGIGFNIYHTVNAQIAMISIPARFIVRFTETREGVNYIVMQDSKMGSGFTCFLQFNISGPPGASFVALTPSAIILPLSACEP